MHRFGEQLEYRIDRRQVAWLCLGVLCWTILAFLLGMMAAERGSVKKNLMALGWWDTPDKNILALPLRVQSGGSGSVAFTFEKAPQTPTSPSHRKEAEKKTKAPLPKQPELRKEPISPRSPFRQDLIPPRSQSQEPVPPVRVSPETDSMESNILEEARAFRLKLRAEKSAQSQTEKAHKMQTKQVDQSVTSSRSACSGSVASATARYYGVSVQNPGDIVSMRRQRAALKQAGYPAKIKRGANGRFYMVVGRFASVAQAQRCVERLGRVERLVGKVMVFDP